MLRDERRRALESILGKPLAAIIVGESRSPRSSVGGLLVLVFEDGTAFEFYSSAPIVPTKHAGTGSAAQLVRAMRDAWHLLEFDVCE